MCKLTQADIDLIQKNRQQILEREWRLMQQQFAVDRLAYQQEPTEENRQIRDKSLECLNLLEDAYLPFRECTPESCETEDSNETNKN